VLAGANMFDFLSHEFAGLSHRRLSLAPCPLRASECLWFRHDPHPFSRSVQGACLCHYSAPSTWAAFFTSRGATQHKQP
jgi:hypothetical protein